MSDSEIEVQNEGAHDMDIGSEVYELGYLLVPTVGEEDLGIEYGNIKELLNSLGAGVISDEMPKMMTLAYPMQKVVANVRHKFTTAYFGWIKFTLEKAKVAELKKKLDLSDTVIRFLIVKTVKENTIASKRFMREDGKRAFNPRRGEDKPAQPIDKEKIDQEIDAMVAAN